MLAKFLIQLLVVVSSLAWSGKVTADVLPVGHKSVKHELVFVESDALSGNRIVAAPIAGFSGQFEIEPGKPFRFSSKYGTRFYVIPDSVNLSDYDRDQYQSWISSNPPISEIKSLPLVSPVKSALTTLRLVGVEDDTLNVELVRHEEFDRNGNTVTELQKKFWKFASWFTPWLAFIVGIVICGWLYFRLIKSKTVSPNVSG